MASFYARVLLSAVLVTSAFASPCAPPKHKPSPATSSASTTVAGIATSSLASSTASSAVSAISTSSPYGAGFNSTGSVVSNCKNSTVQFNDFIMCAPTAQAPQPDDIVPDGAAVYKTNGSNFDVNDFTNWCQAQYKAKLPSKWLVVPAGTYIYDTTYAGDIAFPRMPGGWTIDFRGATFYMNNIPDGGARNPAAAVYVLQSENLTILGGTFWIDSGELFTQATVTSITPTAPGADLQFVEFTVDEGYNTTAWPTFNHQNLGAMNTSNPQHWDYPQDFNGWYINNLTYNAENRTVTTTAGLARSGLRVGLKVYMPIVQSTPAVLSSEDNGALTVRGMTTNGNFYQYGLGGNIPETLENCLITNPPARYGFGTRINGPTINHWNLDSGNFNADGEASPIYENSYWQYTGNVKDLQTFANGSIPTQPEY